METLTTIVKAVLEGSLAVIIALHECQNNTLRHTTAAVYSPHCVAQGKLVIGAVVVLVSLLAIISLQPKRPRATVQKLVIYPIKYTSPTHYKMMYVCLLNN